MKMRVTEVTRLFVVSLVVVILLGGRAMAGQPESVTILFDHYEVIRQALLYDTLDDVADQALEIMQLAESAAGELCSADAGECPEALVAIGRSASTLQDATSIDDARQAFGELSDAFIEYREGVDGPKPVVAHCSMADRSWLQPKGEIGNPYYGQEMARCGEVIAE